MRQADTHLKQILIADDDADARFILEQLLTTAGYAVTAVENGKKALEASATIEFDLALLDVQMPGLSGMQVAEAFKGDDSLRYTPLFLITALGELEDLQRGFAHGADDYIVKPYKKDELLARVSAGLRTRALYEQLRATRNINATLQERSEGKQGQESSAALDTMIGRSASMAAVKELIAKAASADVPVLITGESGTGKELVAAALHYVAKSSGTSSPFVAQNCAALSESLLESEIFGHVKGAFTGALKDRAGLFELANGGTLFLDEIGEMKPVLQAKLLRVLQDGMVTPVGGSKAKKCNVRIVCATNRSLEEEVAAGNFRADLFYRINVLRIALKPLRERLADIPALSSFFLQKISERTGQKLKTLKRETVNFLTQYRWPGNIRELQNEIERLVIMSGADLEIGAELIDERILQERAAGLVATGADFDKNTATLPEALAAVEKRMLSEALARLKGNKSEAARQLGISRSSLIQKASLFGLD